MLIAIKLDRFACSVPPLVEIIARIRAKGGALRIDTDRATGEPDFQAFVGTADNALWGLCPDLEPLKLFCESDKRRRLIPGWRRWSGSSTQTALRRSASGRPAFQT